MPITFIRDGSSTVISEKYIKEIVDILRHEVRSFASIYELLVLEQKCLVECDTPGLVEILERQEDILNSIACLEKSRLEALARIALETGDSAHDMTVTQFAELADGQNKRDLLETGHILARLQEDIRSQKVRNNSLINQAIMFVQSDIRVILNCARKKKIGDPIYNGKATPENNGGGVCVDEKM